jgi:hypothetical protein
MSKNNVIKIDNWGLTKIEADSERRVLDVELGERLGLEKPRNIRLLIKKFSADLEQFGPLPMRPVEMRIEKRGAIHGFESRKVNAYYLNRDQALFIATKSETERANEITVSLIKAFRELERVATASLREIERLERMILAEHRPWELLWTQDVPNALASVYGWDLSGIVGYPQWMGTITEKLYDLIVGKKTMDVVRERQRELGRSVELHQLFTDELRTAFIKKLERLLTIVNFVMRDRTLDKQSRVSRFWYDLGQEFGQPGLQLEMQFEGPAVCRKCGWPMSNEDKFCCKCGTKKRTVAA